MHARLSRREEYSVTSRKDEGDPTPLVRARASDTGFVRGIPATVVYRYRRLQNYTAPHRADYVVPEREQEEGALRFLR